MGKGANRTGGGPLGPEKIMPDKRYTVWTIKFRNGTVKRIKFPEQESDSQEERRLARFNTDDERAWMGDKKEAGQ